nr:endosialidase [uncultured Mediterranean phage uvMED]
MALTQITTDGIKDGTITGTDLTTNVDFVDNQKLRLGTGNDLQIYHDGSHSYIKDTGTGRLILQSSQLCLQSTTGENFLVGNPDAGTELYHNNVKKFETTSNGINVTGRLLATGSSGYGLIFNDDVKISLGSNNDLQIFHNGTDSKITNTTGNLIIDHSNGIIRLDPKTNENGILIRPDGAVELYHDNAKKFETQSIGITVTGQVACDELDMADSTGAGNNRIKLGTGDDLQIYHDGNNSFIKDAGTGRLSIVTSQLQLTNSADSEVMIKATENGAVELYYDNSKKFETTNTGVTVAGNVVATGNMQINDGNFLNVGNSGDLQIYHSSSGGGDSYITNSNGNLNIVNSTDGWIRLQPKSGEEGVIVKYDGAVELYHDNVKRFATISNGAQVEGSLYLSDNSNMHYSDTNKAAFGNSSDLQIYHDGSNSFIKNSTGGLDLNSDTIHLRNGANSETYARFLANGAAELYYDNSKKFQTHSNGVLIYNAIVIDNELNLQSFSDGVARTKYMDIGYAGNTMNFRRTNANDGAHATVMTMNNSLVISGDFHDTSDAKLKKNIKSIADGAMAVIKKLRPVTFDWIDETRRDNVSGFIAQEVLTVLPDLVDGTEYDPTLNDEAKGTKGGIKSDGYSVNSVGITAHLTKALQEAIAKIEALETEVAALKAG